jgi:hypothetical protein
MYPHSESPFSQDNPDGNTRDAWMDSVLEPSVANQPRADARIVEYTTGRYLAFSPHAVLEVQEHPVAIHIPGGAYYAHGLLPWRDGYLPLINPQMLMSADPYFKLSTPGLALVLAFQREAGAALEYGAISIQNLPETVSVCDDMACPLPTDSDLWPKLAVSCFEHMGHQVPIIDVARLFCSYLG